MFKSTNKKNYIILLSLVFVSIVVFININSSLSPNLQKLSDIYSYLSNFDESQAMQTTTYLPLLDYTHVFVAPEEVISGLESDIEVDIDNIDYERFDQKITQLSDDLNGRVLGFDQKIETFFSDTQIIEGDLFEKFSASDTDDILPFEVIEINGIDIQISIDSQIFALKKFDSNSSWSDAKNLNLFETNEVYAVAIYSMENSYGNESSIIADIYLIEDDQIVFFPTKNIFRVNSGENIRNKIHLIRRDISSNIQLFL